ncbi:Cell surface protein [Acidisarcina polymorpha]|uniref:Cell surface protein n=1 Tax=Acidisarcina polymorpha TaxID=2211140 RepID=A0A2Z5FU09_9BACT|nr:SBBP repeat-containing protein [Acidisarcina polymorpha]AXC10321.1 Cell surface protein [Acidisarcina polymorpha]
MKTFLPMVFSLLTVSPLVTQAQGIDVAAATTAGRNLAPSKLIPAAKAPSRVIKADYSKLPLSFEANQGQTDPRVRFASRGHGYSLFLTDSEAVLALTKRDATHLKTSWAAVKTDVIRMQLAGASRQLRVEGADAFPGKVNYFIGKDPANWHRNVPTFAKVKYRGVYPGVDLVYYGNQRQLEYDFVVAPGADPKVVRLRFAGASKLKLDSDGDLNIVAKNGAVVFHKPVVYQVKDGERERIDGRFQLLAKNTVDFQLGAFDPSRELVIDPTVAYSTYLGGNGNDSDEGGFPDSPGDSVRQVVVDAEGYTYVTGTASSLNFPVTKDAFQKTNSIVNPDDPSNHEAFITKLNPAGSALVYSTYFGGTGTDYIGGDISQIAVDASGNVYATGQVNTLDFPTTPGAYDRVANKAGKAFVSKLDPTGSTLVYSTLLGGSKGEGGGGIAVDSAGNAYVTGGTNSTDFPTTPGAFETAPASGFVTKLNATGSKLIYSTYLGGSGSLKQDSVGPSSVFLDNSGNAIIGGLTNSSTFPTTPGAYETVLNIPPNENYTGFVTKLNAEGSKLIYSTYFPGVSIAVDLSGNVYGIATAGPVTSNAFQSKGGGWVGKLNASGTALIYGTYLVPPDVYFGAGNGLQAIAVDQQGQALVAGFSSSPGFPVTPDAFQPTFPGMSTSEGYPIVGVVAELNGSGTGLLYATYLGGSGYLAGGAGASPTLSEDVPLSITADIAGNIYVAGRAESTDFPVTKGAFQTVDPTAGIYDTGYITKLSLHGSTTTTLTSSSASYQAGNNVILTAKVTPVSGDSVPTGIVNFLVDGVSLAKISLDNTGRAIYTTDSLPASGQHTIVASYYGDLPAYSSSNGGPLTITIWARRQRPPSRDLVELIYIRCRYRSSLRLLMQRSTTPPTAPGQPHLRQSIADRSLSPVR